MPRLRRFIAAGINIALQAPHSPERYAELIKAIFEIRTPVKVRGDQHVVISSIHRSDQAPNRVEGTLARFTEIDQDQPWFDLENLDEAEEGDRQSISIPEGLRPNYQSFLFHFDLTSHTLVFEHSSGSQTLGVGAVQRFFLRSVQHEAVVREFGSVSVSIIQSEDALEIIFGLQRTKWIRIFYNLPNPDDHATFEAMMSERLQALGATNVDLTFEGNARSGMNLNDPQIRTLATSALSNGFVKARGYTADNQLITASSEEHPKLESESFDPKATSETDVLRHIVRWFTSRRA